MENLDLRTMRILLALYQCRSIQHAAGQVKLSVAIISHTLATCRYALNDALFVTQANALRPTPVMESVASQLPQLIEQLEKVLVPHGKFEPQYLTGEYTILFNNQLQLLYGKSLFALLSASAPAVSWHFSHWQRDAYEQLIDGRALLGLNYLNSDLPNIIEQHLLGQDEQVILAHPSHPLHQVDLVSLSDAAKYDFISLASTAWDTSPLALAKVFEKTGLRPKVSLITDNCALATDIATSTGNLIWASKALSQSHISQLKALPLETPDKQSGNIVCALAHDRAQEPLMLWLKKMLQQAIKE